MCCGPRNQQLGAKLLRCLCSLTEARKSHFFLLRLSALLQKRKRIVFSCINVDVWVSGKVKSKPRKKIFELQEHKWRIKSLITSRPSLCCSLAAVLIVFSRVENSSILFRYCTKEQSPAEALSGMLVYFGVKTLTRSPRVFLSA